MGENTALTCILWCVIVSLFGIVSTTWGIDTNDKSVNTKTSKSIVAPGKTKEICIRLTPQEKLHYSFTGTEKLSFNIHYHADHKVYFPVSEHLTSVEKDSFEPASKQNYCLMWTNPTSDSVELLIEYEKSISAE